MMNPYWLIAGILCLVLGIVHSTFGEILIFRNKRNYKQLVPTIVNSDFKERHLRIIWATWHLASLFGWCFGAILLRMATEQNTERMEFISFTSIAISLSMLGSSLLVFIGTKGKHPGWIVLLSIAILSLIGIFN